MKTLADINKQLDAFEKEFGIPIIEAAQGSDEWRILKLGVISASRASEAVAKKDSGTRHSYMAELVGQVCTGVMDELSGKPLEWGNTHEDAARSCYEFESGYEMVQLPFVFKDGLYREGCSPDGIVTMAGKPLNKGAEIKCPWDTTHYIKFLTDDIIKPEYRYQYQYTIRVMNAEEWDFVQYDPRMKRKPLKILTVKRDAEYQKKFDDMIPAFIEDMDAMLKKIGVRFGDQWRRLTPAVKPVTEAASG